MQDLPRGPARIAQEPHVSACTELCTLQQSAALELTRISCSRALYSS